MKTHWKKLTNPDYLGAYSLTDQEGKFTDLTVKLLTVSREVITGADGKKDECTVAKLENNKPFIINASNAKTITKLYNTPFVEDWSGKLITLFVAQIRVAGEAVDALRIRPTVPIPPAKVLPEFTEKSPKWNDAVQAIKDGKQTADAVIASLEPKYTLSETTKQTLQNATVQN